MIELPPWEQGWLDAAAAIESGGERAYATGDGVGTESSSATGRIDAAHGSFDQALAAARERAGALGEDTEKMYDPETGTLIGEQSAGGKRGWRIDAHHVNWWDWTEGKKGKGGRFGHEHFPPSQSGPHSKYINFAPWEG